MAFFQALWNLFQLIDWFFLNSPSFYLSSLSTWLPMDRNKNLIVLFDIDGTLTPSRLVFNSLLFPFLSDTSFREFPRKLLKCFRISKRKSILVLLEVLILKSKRSNLVIMVFALFSFRFLVDSRLFQCSLWVGWLFILWEWVSCFCQWKVIP